MPIWPASATGQELYEASTERKHVLGTVHNFDTANGTAVAMYCQNNNTQSLAAGLAVGIGSAGFGRVDTAVLANTAPHENLVLGGLLVSMAASTTGAVTNRTNEGGFGWVVMRGPQTNAFFNTTYASSAAARGFWVSSNAALQSVATTVVTASTLNANFAVIALLRSNSSSISASGTAAGASGGQVMDWVWR